MKFFKNLFAKRPPSEKPSPPKAGDRFVDKVWGDTILAITQISDKGDLIRYRFDQIDGKNYEGLKYRSLCTMPVWLLKSQYKFLDRK
jgi:hypothetical protein